MQEKSDNICKHEWIEESQGMILLGGDLFEKIEWICARCGISEKQISLEKEGAKNDQVR